MNQTKKALPRSVLYWLFILAAGALVVACSGRVPQEAESLPAAEFPHPAETPTVMIVATAVAEIEDTAIVPTRKPASAYADLEIVTLLPRDAIPAVDDPQFLTAEAANEYYDDDELVMGVTFNGEARAYSAPYLSNHEIVNDTVGGTKIAVTW